MARESQRQAARKHKKKLREEGKMKCIQIEFYESDMALYGYAKSQKPTATWIKKLIRENMENS